MNRVVNCGSETIQRFLEGELSESETVCFEQHLETCSRCHDQLALQSAEPKFWDDTQTFLQSVDQLPRLEPYLNESGFVFADPTEPEYAAIPDVPLLPTDDPTKLGRFGGYEISGVIGRGGMGVVLKGWDRSLDRFVAIKVLSPAYAHLSAARQRFAREAKAAAAIVHDNIVAIFGVDSCNGLPYLVMPYIKGESLQRRIDRQAPIGLEEILEISLQSARGLQAAHDQGVIHRDIKPANILLPQSVSRVIITDFGLARTVDDATLTHSGIIAGTPAFMSPEQARGEHLDPRSDLFSLGSVMYAMACGHPPFRADSAYGIMRRVIDDRPRNLALLRRDLPLWFIQIVDQLLEKKPNQRFESAAALAEHLERCLVYLRGPGGQPPPSLRPNQRRSWLVWLLVIVSFLTLGTSVAWFAVQYFTATSTNDSPSVSEPLGEEIERDLDQLELQLQQLELELESLE